MNDEDIDGSPFYVKVFDPNKIRVSGIKAGFVLQPSAFLGNLKHKLTVLNLFICIKYMFFSR